MKITWKKVTAPIPWSPSEPGTDLVGYYGGKTTRASAYNDRDQYTVLLILVPNEAARPVSGTMVLQLADAAGLKVGQPVRIVYKGTKETREGRLMKLFDMYVPDVPALTIEDLPLVAEIG